MTNGEALHEIITVFLGPIIAIVVLFYIVAWLWFGYDQPRKYHVELSDGTKVSCLVNRDNCGISLSQCSDGVGRYCLVNVKVKE